MGVLSLLTRMPCTYDKQSLIKQDKQEEKRCGAQELSLTFTALRRGGKKKKNPYTPR